MTIPTSRACCRCRRAPPRRCSSSWRGVRRADADRPICSAYYDGLRVLFGADDASGQHVPIADTGRFDWVGQLTSNRKLRFVASGLGIQLAPLRFAEAPG